MIHDIICLFAFVRLLCFLVLHYKVDYEAIKTKRHVIADNIEQIRDILDIYCSRNSAFAVYCKIKRNTIDERYLLAEQENPYLMQPNNISRLAVDIENLENMERSYYGIYKDNILFA
jgi:hypothetical protein